MNALKDPDTDQLLQSAVSGDDDAAEELLHRHRQRLRNLIQIRLDAKLAGRVDPSDVVQDVLLTAHRRLDRRTPPALDRIVPPGRLGRGRAGGPDL